MIPKDPVMLLSYGLQVTELQEKLKAINYEYDRESNQFR